MGIGNRAYDKKNDGAIIEEKVDVVIKSVLSDSLKIDVSGDGMQWFFHKEFKVAPFQECCLKTKEIITKMWSYEEY